MSTEIETMKTAAAHLDWPLWLRQIRAILRVDIKKNFWGKRALLLYLFAAIPVLLMFMVIVFNQDAEDDIRRRWSSALEAFGYIYEALVLRTMVFFGCAWIFMNLFRGEVVDKSLHYYFLAPLRREVLVAGKY